MKMKVEIDENNYLKNRIKLDTLKWKIPNSLDYFENNIKLDKLK